MGFPGSGVEDAHETSEEDNNSTENRAGGHGCGIQKANLEAGCLCPDNFSEAEFSVDQYCYYQLFLCRFH